MKSHLTIPTLALFFPFSVLASTFSNSFVEFELPEGWQCKQNKRTWVCSETGKNRDAIILVFAKKRSKRDTIDQFQKYANNDHTFVTKTKSSQKSRKMEGGKKFSGTDNINGQIWSKGLFIDSMVPGYLTRHMNTVKQDLSISFTTLISKNRYGQYSTFFDKTINSLKVFHNPSPVTIANTQPVPVQNPIPVDIPAPVETTAVFATPPEVKQTTEKKLPFSTLAIAAAIVGGLLLWLRKRRNDS